MTDTADRRLLAAVRVGDLAEVRAALAAGADARATHAFEEAIDRERHAGHESLLQVAARAGNAEVVALLLAHGADADAADTVMGRSPLVEAAARGDQQVVARLLAAGARVRNDAERPHADALVAALTGDHTAVVRALVGAGAMATPGAFEIACQRGVVEHVELCWRSGAAVTSECLAAAARGGATAVVHWLLERGVDLAAAGGDALCEAANAARAEVVAMLLARGVSPAYRNSYAWTPLHFAAWQADAATCEPLLRAGADPHATDGQGRTPLDWAIEAGRADVVALLRRA